MEPAERKENVDVQSNRKSLESGKDDSLADFKSPKQNQAVSTKPKIILDTRAKKTSAKGKSSSNKKKETVQREIAQPSIESSFFKAAINDKRDGHTCPLCMKYFDDKTAGSCHTKSCATKNNVSTKKLLAAVALQKRQADERVAIGLPAGPIIQPKIKAPKRHRETVAKDDPDLQLALALSKSLQENKLEQEFEEALLLAEEHRGDGKITVFASDSDRRKTLKNFGFITNKPIENAEVPARTRRKKHLGPTILQTRSKEARDRLLTDRIAEVLMGNEAITQLCHQEINPEIRSIVEQRVILRSRVLQTIHEDTERLWDYAQLPETVTSFYVEELGPTIVPAVRSSEENSEKPTAFARENATEEFVKDSDSPIPEVHKNSPTSETREQIEKMSPANKSRSPKSNDVNITDRRYRNTLSTDWTNTLNVSSSSDVVIFVDEGHIWAHKLVFHVRCSNILLDCEINSDPKFNSVKEKIVWSDVDSITGLAFLEFVYSGLIEKNAIVFDDERKIGGVRRLARKYRVKALFDYLRNKQTKIDKIVDNADESESAGKSESRIPIVIETREKLDEIDSQKPVVSPDVELNKVEDDEKELLKISQSRTRDDFSVVSTECTIVKTINTDSPSKNTDAITVISLSSSREMGSVSPDLFDETTVDVGTSIANNNNENHDANDVTTDNENSNLKVLADLIAEENFSLSTEASQESAPSIVARDDTSVISRCVDETISHVETPKSSKLFREKSNITLFIEKVQRINAKGAFDSYSEEDSPAWIRGPKRRRNPFNINNVTDSSLPRDVDEKTSNDRRLRRDEKRGLSVFDEIVESTIPMENNLRRSTTFENVSTDVDDVSETERSIDDESMYSRYRKNHRTNNSIVNYRNMLKELDCANRETVNDRANDDCASTSAKPIDLTQESDSDVDSPSSPDSRRDDSRASQNVCRDDGAAVRKIDDTMISSKQSDDRSNLRNGNFDDRSRKSGLEEGNKDDVDELDTNITNVLEYSINSTPEIVDCPENLNKNLSQEDDDADDIVECPRNLNKSLSQENEDADDIVECPHDLNENLSRKNVETDEIVVSPENLNKTVSQDDDDIDEIENNEYEKNVQYHDDNDVTSDVAVNIEKSTEYPDLDVFEIDENIFHQNSKHNPVENRRSFESSSSKLDSNYLDRSSNSRQSFESSSSKVDSNYLDRSSSSRRRRRAAEKRTKDPDPSHDDDSRTKYDNGTTDEISEHRDTDADRSFERNRRSDENFYQIFEPDDNVFTQTMNFSDLSRRGSASNVSPDRSPLDDNNDRRSGLKPPSPIVISSSPEYVSDVEKNNFREPNSNVSTNDVDKSMEKQFSRKSFEDTSKKIVGSTVRDSTNIRDGDKIVKEFSIVNRDSTNFSKNSMVRWNSMPTGSSDGRLDRKRTRTPKKNLSRLVMSQDVTPPVNYDTMDTPELKRELNKYGIKPQKRNRARQLLNHIYNELHPVVPVLSLAKDSEIVRTSSSDDEPPAKIIAKSTDRNCEDSDSDTEIPLSQQSPTRHPEPVIPEEIDFADGNGSPDGDNECSMTSGIKKAFHELIKDDKDMHNKILTYEPLPLELLSLMLKARGFKVKSNDLMDFLDEECITFQVQSQRTRTRKARGTKTGPSEKAKSNSRKS